MKSDSPGLIDEPLAIGDTVDGQEMDAIRLKIGSR